MNLTLAKLLAYAGALGIIVIGVIVLATAITLFVLYAKFILSAAAIVAVLVLLYFALRNIANRLYTNWLKGKL